MDCSHASPRMAAVLTQEVTKLLGSVCEREQIPDDWCESVTARIYKKGDKYSCKFHRQIRFGSIVLKMFSGIILCRLSHARKNCTVENGAGFRSSWDCVDDTLTLRQALECTTCSEDPRYLPCLISSQ